MSFLLLCKWVISLLSFLQFSFNLYSNEMRVGHFLYVNNKAGNNVFIFYSTSICGTFVIYLEIIPMKLDPEMKHVSTVISGLLQYWNRSSGFLFVPRKRFISFR